MNLATQSMIKGQCLCGAVIIAVSGSHDPRVGACHCLMCQRWSGGPFFCFEAASDAVKVSGPVKRYSSSSFAERAFCSICGAHLWMRDTDRKDASYDLMPGLFTATHTWPLRSEIYADRAPTYAALSGNHVRGNSATYEMTNPFVEGDDK